jgi:predicted metal-dependent peptidase
MTGRGDTPGEWSRWVEQVLEPKVPWQQVLTSSVRRAVAWTHGNTHPTYRKLSRRQAASPRAILPGSQKPVPSVAVVVDTSGSMDDGLLAQAVGEVDGSCRPSATPSGPSRSTAATPPPTPPVASVGLATCSSSEAAAPTSE